MPKSSYVDNLWVRHPKYSDALVDDHLTNFIILELCRNPPEGVSVGLGDDENIFHWGLDNVLLCRILIHLSYKMRSVAWALFFHLILILMMAY